MMKAETVKSMNVPLLDLKQQHAALREELRAGVERVFESQHFILGEDVRQFETEFASYTQTKHAVGCGSGSDALLLALQALDIGPGDEVILPTFTFFASAGAVCRLGARPVPLQIPIGQEDGYEGHVDLLTMKAIRYVDPLGAKWDEGEIPDELKEQAEQYHHDLIEAVLKASDASFRTA